jgi:hypothetical protein
MINPFSKPRTPEEWREAARIIDEQLQGLSIAELMRGSAQHGEPSGQDGRGYDPNQPRVPAGHSDGGRWTNKAKTGGERVNDLRVLSDPPPDDHGIPGAQYVQGSHSSHGPLSQATNNALADKGAQQKPATFLGTDRIARTIVTRDGEIRTEYYERYYQMTPLEQEAVRVHEGVHVKQLRPYADRGWLGALQAIAAYKVNLVEWEIEAYKAEYDFLNDYPIENLSQGMRDVLYYRRNAVRNNLEYYCRLTGGAKRKGC